MRFPLFAAALLSVIIGVGQARADVVDDACRRYSLPKNLVLAIIRQESGGNPWCVNVAGRDYNCRSREEALEVIHRNINRSYDVGLMQVNVQWLKKFGISPEAAIDPANNAQLGCWILASEVKRYGMGWKAVGAYHSPNPERQRKYAGLVARHLRTITKQ